MSLAQIELIDPELATKLSDMEKAVRETITPPNDIWLGCIPPNPYLNLDETDIMYGTDWEPLEEDVIAYQTLVWSRYEAQFLSLYSTILASYYTTNSELERQTRNFMISFKSYITFYHMTPRPDYFRELGMPDLDAILLALNGAKSLIMGYDNNYFWSICEEGVPPENDTSDINYVYVEPPPPFPKFTTIKDVMAGTLNYKLGKVEGFYNAVNAMQMNVGIEFLYKKQEEPIHVDITIEEQANKIYLDLGLKKWIEKHGMNIPIYTYDI